MTHATSDRSSGRRAFFLGVVGAVAAIVLVFFIEDWFFHPMRRRPIAEALLLSIPLVMAFVWSAMLRVSLEAAPKGAASAGYASVFGLLGILMMVGHSDGFPMVQIASVVIWSLGYLGETAMTSRLPGMHRHQGPPREPVCPHCGYELYYVRDHLCPDCGKPFRSADIDMRLARWEEGVLKPLGEDEQG